MRVLQLCNKPPYPPLDGGCLAMHSITEGLLSEDIDITVLAINTSKHPFDKENVPQQYIDETKFQTSFVDTGVKPVDAFVNLFSNKAYNIERFYSGDFERLILETLEKNQFEIIQFESLYVMPYLNIVKKHSSAKLVLRSHNLEHVLWERRAAEEKNAAKKFYFNLLASRIKKYETDLLKDIDAVITITEKDEQFFKNHNCRNTFSVPFGLDINKYNSSDTASGVCFIGSLDWEPNTNGLLWFMNNVWKNASPQIPGTKMYIAGKNTPQRIKVLSSPVIIVEGEVPDAITFINKHNIMVAPLFSGSGMRIKLIEGMALGKTIITTTIGAEGIPCTNGENILIADTAEDFSTQLIKCVNDKNYCSTIGKNARAFVQNNYDNKIISKKLVGFYNSIVNLPRK